jgi:hypothetical protein
MFRYCLSKGSVTTTPETIAALSVLFSHRYRLPKLLAPQQGGGSSALETGIWSATWWRIVDCIFTVF